MESCEILTIGKSKGNGNWKEVLHVRESEMKLTARGLHSRNKYGFSLEKFWHLVFRFKRAQERAIRLAF